MRWTAYPLNTKIPPEGIPLKHPFDPGDSDSAQMNKRLIDAAEKAGLPLGRRTSTYNTGLAHELGKWADSQGKGDAYHNAVFRAFFAEGSNIASTSVMVDLAEGIGLSGKEAKKVAETRQYRDAVEADWKRSLEVDPEYIPSLLVKGQLLVNPQEYELFEQFMVENKVARRSPNGS